MAVNIFDEDAFERMVFVEGEEYRICKGKDRFGDWSFEAFLEMWKRDCHQNNELKVYSPKFALDVNGNGAIYGLGGWNRYVVFNTGEIAIIERQAVDPESLRKAKEAGFSAF